MPAKPSLHHAIDWLPTATWMSLGRDLNVSADRLHHAKGGEDRVRVEHTWLETSVDHAWMSAARIAVQDGQLVVAELRIFPNEPALDRRPAAMWSAELLGTAAPVPRGGLSIGTVRKVRLSDYRRYTRQILSKLQEKYSSAAGRDALGVAFGPVVARQPISRPRRERPGARPDLFYAKLAAEYARATERGSRQPVAELATRHRVKKPRMRDMIREARERGLLTFFAQGRPGGALTGRASEMLQRRKRR